MSEAPVVYCPKEKKEVPIWYCLGSLTQGRSKCPNLIRATVNGMKSAEVECKLTKYSTGKNKTVSVYCRG